MTREEEERFKEAKENAEYHADNLFAELHTAWEAQCYAWDDPPDFPRWIIRRIADIQFGVERGKTSDGRHLE